MKDHQVHDRALDALFTDGELPADAAAVTRSLREDAAARRRFDDLALADRALRGADVGEFERALGRASFMAGLDALLEEEAAGERVAPVIPLFGPRARVAALAASALLVSALAYWASPRGASTGEDPEGFQPRTALTSASGAPAGPRVEVFCVERSGSGELRFRGRADVPMGALSCPTSAEIKLAHGDPGARTYVAMFGATRDGRLHWYGPSAAAPQAIEARRAPRELWGFGESIRLGVNHSAGPVRVHALFSSAPLSHDKVRELAERVPAPRRFDEARLDVGGGVASSSVVFEVSDQEERR